MKTKETQNIKKNSTTINPKVSIVIPVYNGAIYMKEAIDSALAQTYDNIEIIVVNDGSTDETDKIALSYGNKIRYFKKENGGVSTALNLGIKEMTGEYFSWLSHDDIYMPEKIEKQIELLSSLDDKNTILYSNYKFIDENSEPIYQPVIHNHEMLTKKQEYALYRGCINGLTLLVNKKIFDDVGLFNEELRCTQDYEMWLRMIKKRYRFVHMPDVLVITRLHSKQATNCNPKVLTEGNKIWIEMIDALSTNDKIRLEGSEYNFYDEMISFLETTPYEQTKNYCFEQKQKILLNEKYIIIEKMKETKVSVIIPFYNRIDKLKNAIESVLTQTHKYLEIILVNDCSTENIEIIKEYINNDERIKLINLEKNLGPASARNIGIGNSSGEYIVFLDSDDSFVNDKIKKQLFEMIIRGSNISHTSYLRKSSKREDIIHSGIKKGIVIPEFIYNCPIATPTVMIKKEFLINSGVKFNENLKIGEDTCYWLELLKNEQLFGIDEALTIVNTDENSAAYNTEKSIKGIKNILTYLLNDEKYKHFDIEISLLCEIYIDNINLKYGKYNNENTFCPNCLNLMHSPSWVYTRPFRFVMRYIRMLKEKGIVFMLKKFILKVKRIIKGA